MMGHTHAMSGLVAYLAAVPALQNLTPATPAELAVGGGLAAGAAMVPDLDCPSSTIARTYGPLTDGLSHAIAWLSGGHRNGTHSILGIGVFTGLALGAALAGGWALRVTVWLLLGVAARALGIAIPRRGGLTALAHAAGMGAAAWAIVYAGLAPVFIVPVAVGIGCVAHIAGDCLTDAGCPLGWPFSQRMLSAELLDTGSWVETRLLSPALVVAMAALSFVAVGGWPRLTALLETVG